MKHEPAAKNRTRGRAWSARTLHRLWIGIWLASFLLTHTPRIPHPKGAPDYADKIVHFALYFGVTIIAGYARRAAGTKHKSHSVWWGMLFILYAMVDELTQPLVGRSAEFADWLADVFGVIVATALVIWRSVLDGRRPGPSAGGGG